MNNSNEKQLLESALKHGLTQEEFYKIKELLGRLPNSVELGMYSVMWSEHCSYKNSINELKKLPRDGDRLLVKAGEENAGLVDIGDGLAIAFKIESHNHPSAVEPYQGAATGVGGIMRDIFTMGARPIAALNSLRFGNPKNSRTQYLIKGIIKGIGDYGNSFGVPTVAGDVFFDDCYDENPLVNAMAVGIVEHSQIAKAIAKGQGNIVMIVGSSTGRDGIHGATFASENISDESQDKRPSVQVGDPFTEKLLLEATLEAISKGYIIGIQDMGAAGITCSTTEMSAHGNSGMIIDLNKVPLREKEMSAYEILLSESQERMLVIIKPADRENLTRIYSKWDLNCQEIGIVTDEQRLIIKHKGETVADVIPNTLVLGGGAPVYHRESKEPEYIKELRSFDTNSLPEPNDYSECLLKLLSSPNICSRNWITEQYDSSVRTNTVLHNGITDAAIVRIKGTQKAIALKTDCNPRYTFLNPYKGGQIAVAESARNVVCIGAKPIAITNCLNFGNPYNPEIFFQFKEAVRGIGDACRMFSTPVTGGNVSFYNESNHGPVYPTPVIGMLGIIESLEHIITSSFKMPGDSILLLGKTNGHIGGSEYLKVVHNAVKGDAPEIDLAQEKKLQDACLYLIKNKLIQSCHDLSDGGLAIALAESCISSYMNNNHVGCSIKLSGHLRTDFELFGEDQGRMLVSISPENLTKTEAAIRGFGIDCERIGVITDNGLLQIGNTINLPILRLHDTYTNSFPVK